MKSAKKEFRFFTIAQYEQEQEYLRRRHNEGWAFVSVSFPGIYTFRKCEPEDVVYQLDFNQDAEAEKEEYIRMFEDCGWEYMMDFVGYSYFRKPVDAMKAGEEEIFCDDESRLEMMKRVFKGKMKPLLIVFFLVIIPNLLLQSRFDSQVHQGLWWTFVVLAAIYIWMFAWYAYTYWKYFNGAK